MRPIFITRVLTAAVANSIALSQTTAGAAALTLNGALATNGVATLAAPGQVTLTSTGALTGINFTLVGTDYRGWTVSEILAGPGNNTVTSVNSYATITSITSSATVGTNITAGNAASGSSPVVPIDTYANPSDISLGVEITGTANVTVQYTVDNVFVTTSLDALNWISHANLTGLSASAYGTLISSVGAVRMITNSGTGSVTFVVRQAGGTGGS